jgi:hypothetical protein
VSTTNVFTHCPAGAKMYADTYSMTKSFPSGSGMYAKVAPQVTRRERLALLHLVWLFLERKVEELESFSDSARHGRLRFGWRRLDLGCPSSVSRGVHALLRRSVVGTLAHLTA